MLFCGKVSIIIHYCANYDDHKSNSPKIIIIDVRGGEDLTVSDIFGIGTSRDRDPILSAETRDVRGHETETRPRRDRDVEFRDRDETLPRLETSRDRDARDRERIPAAT